MTDLPGDDRRPPDLDFQTMLDFAPDAFLVCDRSGRVRYSNLQAEVLFGYTREELGERIIEDLLPHRFRVGHFQQREEYAGHAHSRPMGIGLDLRALTKDGREVAVEVSLSPIRGGGDPLVAAAVRDVSAQRKAREELEEAHRVAERAGRANARFLAVASHDLRQPLQAAVNYLAVLERRLGDHPAQEIVAKLDRSLTGVRELLNRLLDISKLEGGSVTPERRPILVGELFDRLKDDLLPSVEEKGLHLRIAAHSVTVYSDPLLLMEMLQNLLVNAVRYTRKGGVLLAARRSGSHVRLQVYDTGIGIPQDRLDDIFVEFVQVDDKVRRRQPGLGLGLAIVKRLGELLDHPVAVRSVEGRGTVAEVRVPLARRPGAQKHATAEEAAGGSSYRIAVIDNEPEVLDSMVLLLQALGHQPVPGGSAEDLVRALGPSAPDLILCNFELERGRCGLVEIQSLRNAMGIPELPAVLLTGDSSRDRREEARQSGFRLINKPVDAVHLARIIEGTVLNPRAGVYDEVEVR